MKSIIKKSTESQVIQHFDNHRTWGVGEYIDNNVRKIAWHLKDWSLDYLTFIPQSDCQFKFTGNTSNTLQYSLDNGYTWTSLAYDTYTPTLHAGQKILWKGENLTQNVSGSGQFKATGTFNVNGNIMSLLYGDNFVGQTSLAGKDLVFASLFNGQTGLMSAKDLSLPATTLSQQCYQQMFFNCSNLADAPGLPAETLSIGCYYLMFNGTKITKAPVLPASALTEYCYNGMFANCTRLTTAPTLPAATLEDYCYQAMFCGCTSLNRIECYATDISATDCTDDWVKNVASDGTFVEVSTMDSWTRGVDGIPVNWRIERKKHDYSQDYLTFRAQEDGTFKFSGSSASNTLQYSLDNGGTWQTLAHDTNSSTVQSGDTIMFKASELTINSTSGIGWFISTGQFKAEGDVMSLVFGDDFIGQESLRGKNYVFRCLFSGCTGLTSAENLSLPATTLAVYSYYNMFRDCTSLTTAPDLPATTLVNYCYEFMFNGCTSLTTAPVLPATTLADYCYRSMFAGCTSLTTAPELPATTLAQGCYYVMFAGCTSLTTAQELPATTLNSYCYRNMFQGCTSLTTAPELPATTLANYCYYSMFSGCSSLSAITCLAVDISATDCTNNWVVGVSGSGIFTQSSANTTWTTGVNGIPVNWTVSGRPDEKNYLTFEILSSGNIGWKLSASTGTAMSIEYKKNDGAWTEITATTAGTNISVVSGDVLKFRGDNASYGANSQNYFTATANFKVKGNIMSLVDSEDFENVTAFTSNNNFNRMFTSCTTLQDISELELPPTVVNGCYSRMFQGCTNITEAPFLPASALDQFCYYNMFNGCSKLSYVRCLAETGINTNSSTSSWLSGVASSGTFVKASGSSWPSSTNGIPSSWTVQDV